MVLSLWLLSAATGSAEYAEFNALLATTIGQLLLVGWSFAFFFHLANGVRHLIWDMGRGFEKNQAIASSWFILLGSIVLTAAFWLLIIGGSS